jgi:hypothetical protein
MTCALVVAIAVPSPAWADDVLPGAKCTGFTISVPLTANGTMFEAVTTWGEGRAWVGGWTHTSKPGEPLSSPVMQRWDGHEWQAVDGRPDGLRGGIGQMTATGPDEVWASGYRYTDDSGSAVPMLLRVTGRTWTVESLPAEPPLADIRSLFAATPQDLWVAGTTTTADGHDRSVLLHRTGAGWQSVLLPVPPDALDARINSISGTGPSDVWAAGWVSQPDPAAPATPLVSLVLAHWNGRGWTTVPGPDGTGGALDSAPDFAAGRRDAVWLLATRDAGHQERYALEHRDDHGWTIIAFPPRADGVKRYFLDLTTDRLGNLWLLSKEFDAVGDRTRADRWDGRTWTEQPIPAELGNKGGGVALATSALGRDTWMIADWSGGTWPLQYRSLVLRSTCA